MTQQEENTERRDIYEERLGILGYGPGEMPSLEHHKMAVEEADNHMLDLKLQEVKPEPE